MRKLSDWKQSCPNPDCKYYTLMSRGNVSAVSTYLTQSGRRQIIFFRFSTIFHGLTRACEFLFRRSNDFLKERFILNGFLERRAWLPGFTDHVWSFRELLTIKFEPIHNQSISG